MRKYLEAMHVWKSEDQRKVCLYRVNGNKGAEVLGVATLYTRKVPWELKMVWAPGRGKRFHELLVAYAGGRGLTPTREPGRIVPPASRVWKALEETEEYRIVDQPGPHFEPWLNATYYSGSHIEELRQLRTNHREWVYGSCTGLARALSSLLRPHKRRSTQVGKLASIQAKADKHLRKVSELYFRGGTGYQAIGTYAAKLLAQRFATQSEFTIQSLTAGEGYDGFIDGEHNSEFAYCFYQNAPEAKEMAKFRKRKVRRITLPTPCSVLVVDRGPGPDSIIQDGDLQKLIAGRLGQYYLDFLTEHWDTFAKELGHAGVVGFVRRGETCILRMNG